MMFFSSNRFKKSARYLGLISMIMGISLSVKAESPPPPASISNPFVIILLIIMVVLAFAIGILANVVMGAANVQAEKEKEEAKGSGVKIPPAAIMLAGLLMLSSPGWAQEKAAGAVSGISNVAEGISSTAFYMIAWVIFLELIVLLGLLYNLRMILNIERRKRASVKAAAAIAAEKKPKISWWDRFNSFKPIEQEVDIDLGHNYDGIRELDNRLPPWWLYGFYLTILVGCIYLWRYHVAQTAPLSREEYQIAMNEAAVQKEAYLKRAANNIDETNVKFMSATGNLEAGKAIFTTICSACHGKEGQGTVGPNLTDDYWIHGGSINDIFKTIKYGYPEKGMKSWKDDYSPTQIANLASYIQTLHGTNPPNPKAPQGTLYSPTQSGTPAAAADSTSKNKDSTKQVTL
jgi:cytochrome c oxidase cbb3-type subunit III